MARHPAYERLAKLRASERRELGLVKQSGRSGLSFRHRRYGINSSNGVDNIPIALAFARINAIRTWPQRQYQGTTSITVHQLSPDGLKKARAWVKQYGKLTTRQRAVFRQAHCSVFFVNRWNRIFRRYGIRLRLTARRQGR